MRPKTLSFVLIGVLVSALLLIAYHVSRAREETDAQYVAARQDQAKLRRELQAAQRAQSAMEEQCVTLKTSIAALQAKPAPAPVPKRTGSINSAAIRANNPQLANLWIAAQEAQINQSYGRLFQSLRLPPEQTEQLKAIMTNGVARYEDIGAAALAQGLGNQDPAIKALRRQADEEAKAAEAVLLGPDGFRKLQDYYRSISTCGVVDGLAGVVACTDPLTARQADELTKILANASRSYREGNGADLREVNWPAVDEQARAILSPSQFAVWQQGATPDARSGNSRSEIQLQNAFDQAVKAEKAREAAEP